MVRVWFCAAIVTVLLLGVAPSRSVSCVIDPCLSSATSTAGTLLVCPAGDGPALSSIGATVNVTVLACDSSPTSGIPADEFWIVSHNSTSLALCGGHLSSNGDADIDANGQTTISGSVAAGGFSSDVHVVAQGFAIGLSCDPDVALPLVLVSPDISGDLVVGIVDVALFAIGFPSSVKPYDARLDFNGDGIVNLVDLSAFARHLHHRCE